MIISAALLFAISCSAPSEEVKTLDNKEVVLIQANKETTQGISNMKSRLAKLPASPSTDEYSALEKDLRSEFTSILRQCTMKGADHDSLHSYLQPMEGYFTSIGSGNADSSQAAISRLNSHLSDYSRRFR
jgi:hypothetical protein